MKINSSTLHSISVFEGLERHQLDEIAGEMRSRSYTAKQEILAQNDPTSDVFFIISGTALAAGFSNTGKEVHFEELGPGTMFGELAAIDGGTRSAHVIAKTDTQVATLSAEKFWETMRRYPVVSANTMKRLSRLIRDHCDRIFEYRTLGVQNRIHAELLRLARKQGGTTGPVVITNPPTHTEIADRVATHREAVSRELSRLKSIGLIEWDSKGHIIKSLEDLERMVQDVKGM